MSLKPASGRTTPFKWAWELGLALAMVVWLSLAGLPLVETPRAFGMGGAWASASSPKFRPPPPEAGKQAIVLAGTPNLCGVNCGKVLVAERVAGVVGLYFELYDPARDLWTPLPNPPFESATGSFILIEGTTSQCGFNCGKVLVHLEIPDDTDQWMLFDPLTNGWLPAGLSNVERHSGVAVVALASPRCRGDSPPGYCGQVLAIGGYSDNPVNRGGSPGNKAEIYDPKANSWTTVTTTASDNPGTFGLGLGAPLGDGRALLVSNIARNAAVYDPEADGVVRKKWTKVVPPRQYSDQMTATALADGRVLFVGGGGVDGMLFDPDPAKIDPWSFTASCLSAGCTTLPVFNMGATSLPSGKALVTGGDPASPVVFNDPRWKEAWVYDAKQDRWARAPSMLARRASHQAVLLEGPNCGRRCGKVLAIGGDVDDAQIVVPQTAELYTPDPAVEKLLPALGPTRGGTPVSIVGTGFPTDPAVAVTVTFGGTSATEIRLKTATEMEVVSPPHDLAEKVHVEVATSDGVASEATDADLFEYFKLPEVVGIDPACGPLEGGTLVNVTGRNLTSQAAVNFGGLPARSVTWKSDTQIIAETPASSRGARKLTVRVPGQGVDAELSPTFTYPCPPVAVPDPSIPDPTSGTGTTVQTVQPTSPGPGGNTITVRPPSPPLPAATGQNAPPGGAPAHVPGPGYAQIAVPNQSASYVPGGLSLSQGSVQPAGLISSQTSPGAALVPNPWTPGFSEDGPQAARQFLAVGRPAGLFGPTAIAGGTFMLFFACLLSGRRPAHVLGRRVEKGDQAAPSPKPA